MRLILASSIEQIRVSLVFAKPSDEKVERVRCCRRRYWRALINEQTQIRCLETFVYTLLSKRCVLSAIWSLVFDESSTYIPLIHFHILGYIVLSQALFRSYSNYYLHVLQFLFGCKQPFPIKGRILLNNEVLPWNSNPNTLFNVRPRGHSMKSWITWSHFL